MKVFARFVLITAALLTLIILVLTHVNYSEGTRAGFVIKVSKKGVFFKTWEGQLNLQSFGAASLNNSFSEVFDFSIPKGDTAIYRQLQEVSLTGERINMHYIEKLVKLPWNGDTKYFVTKIDRLEIRQGPQNRDPYRDNRNP
jgi:hypothetical protein